LAHAFASAALVAVMVRVFVRIVMIRRQRAMASPLAFGLSENTQRLRPKLSYTPGLPGRRNHDVASLRSKAPIRVEVSNGHLLLAGICVQQRRIPVAVKEIRLQAQCVFVAVKRTFHITPLRAPQRD
jgi:hypothetical protein